MAYQRVFLTLANTLFLIVFLVGLPLGASESPNRSAGRHNLGTEATVVQLLGVSSSSEAEFSRVSVDLSADAQYKVSYLSNPERLYIDFSRTAISPRLVSRRIALQDELIDRIRLGTDSGSVTRMVFDLRTAVRYRILKLGGPTRMLVELSRYAADPILPQDRSSPDSNQGDSGATATPAYAGRALAPSANEGAEKAGLSYAGTAPPRNVLALGLNTESAYDDNILGGNQQRIGDAYFLIGPTVNLRREASRFSLALDYQPHVRIYRKTSEFNTIDQGLAFDAAYRMSPRLTLGANTNVLYTSGFYQPGQTEQTLPGIGSPSGFNQTVFTSSERRFMVASRINGSYQASPHDSFGVFLGQSTLTFQQQLSIAGSLRNTVERDGGLVYGHRLRPHVTVGIDYLLQDIDFGPDSRTFVQSGLFSYAQQLSPTLSFSVFGGPQYSRLEERGFLSPGPSAAQPTAFITQWNWAAGGEVTKRSDRIVFMVSAQHQATNGGGLLGAVVTSSIAASVRHPLAGGWDAVWTAGYADNNSLTSTFSQGHYRSFTAGVGLHRPLTEKLSFGARYDFVHQTGTGNSAMIGSFDRDVWSVQLSYRFRDIALGQ